jgi:hypothetical protein
MWVTPGYGTSMPRFVPASVTELQRVGLFASLPGETLTKLAEQMERIEVPSGGTIGGSDDTVDVLLTGLARGSAGLLRPGDVVQDTGIAVTQCVVARCDREALADVR